MKQTKFLFGQIIFIVGMLTFLPALGQAQQETPRAEIFAGYSWLNPGGTIATTPIPSGATIGTAPTFTLPGIKKGFGVDGSLNFNRWFGIKADINGHYSDPANIHTFMFGPKLSWRSENVTFFGEALGGIEHFSSPSLKGNTSAVAAFGGGVELWINRRIAWRAIQADYLYQTHPTEDVGQTGTFHGARLQSGIVFGLGSLTPAAMPTASCSVRPAEVMVGEPVTATASGNNFNPKHTLSYRWSGTGVAAKGATANIDTTNAAPGMYIVTAKVIDPKLKKNNESTCTAQYTVKPLPPKNPPTMSCSASPASVQAGGSVTVNCKCSSPDGVPVSVQSWTSTAGAVDGSGRTATVNTSSVAPGRITVGAVCSDSRGLTTQASAAVTVENPPAPVVDKKLEARLALHSVYFPTSQPTPKNPNGGLVKSQEQTLSTLASDFKKYLEAKPDARLTLEGHADVRGSIPYNQALSERRVTRVKNYLIEQGVPEPSILTKAFGEQHNLTEAEVKASVEQNSELTKEEKAKLLRNIKTIIWASNRRVDIVLNAAGQTEASSRQYPFNAADSLTLLSDRETAKKGHATKKSAEKPTTKQQ